MPVPECFPQGVPSFRERDQISSPLLVGSTDAPPFLPLTETRLRVLVLCSEEERLILVRKKVRLDQLRGEFHAVLSTHSRTTRALLEASLAEGSGEVDAAKIEESRAACLERLVENYVHTVETKT